MVNDEPGSPWCRQPVERGSRIDPCMPGWLDVVLCVWSVYGQVVFFAAAWLVHGCVSHLMVSVELFLLLPALSRPRLSCGRRVRSRLLGAKVRVRAARYGESLWPWGQGFEVGRCGWLVRC